MVQQDNFRLASLVFSHKDIAGVGVTVDVAVVKDHLAVHLADFSAHVVHVDALAPQTGTRTKLIKNIHNQKSRIWDPDPHGSALIRVAGSGSRRAKMTHKKEKS
jgi:hypothetical protein